MTIKLLMCRPEYFTVNYVINPWMVTHGNNVDREKMMAQWHHLYETLIQHASISLIEPKLQAPDFVFTANAGLIKNKQCVLSHFRYQERQQEETSFEKWFDEHDYDVIKLPHHLFFEGEGDALFQPKKEILWLGHGIRTDKKSISYLEDIYNLPVVPLKLINNNFYHLDTCFCPLLNDYVMYYPKAFDHESLKSIEKLIAKEKRIIVNDADANHFSCNSILLHDNYTQATLVMNAASPTLQHQLSELGYKIIITPVTEFIKAGGATKCLVLTLS